MQSYVTDTNPVGADAQSTHPEPSRSKKSRSRRTIACDACRARRTRCDNRRPACGYCRARGIDCHYEQSLQGHAPRVEAELAAINRRLDQITNLVQVKPSTSPQQAPLLKQIRTDDVFTGEEKSPFQLLGSDCIMDILGLGPDFAHNLLKLERAITLPGLSHAPRMRIMQQEHAILALASFSTHVHCWYPILRPGFSQRYFGIISGVLAPSPESCLVLLVAAIGTLTQQDPILGVSPSDGSSEQYFDLAMASLPSVLVDGSIDSVQSLILLAVYYCCLEKPCQAYDYAMVASFKVQNLLRCTKERDNELFEHIKRAYWAVLLLESELRVQFDVVESGIWNHDDDIPLPDSRRTWQFDVATGSPATTITSPGSDPSAINRHTDTTQAYFLAEISMRRMLHRCNTAIRRTVEGEIVYAPNIARELESQLEEWYGYLPASVQFKSQDLEDDDILSRDDSTNIEPLGSFLRVQYFCCKISIYWPAVYQSIQDGTASPELLRHCERFFNAYIQVMPSMLQSIRDCIVNRWTLYATVFMASMAVLLATETPCMRAGCAINWTNLCACVKSAEAVDLRIVRSSPSLVLMHEALIKKVAEL